MLLLQRYFGWLEGRWWSFCKARNAISEVS